MTDLMTGMSVQHLRFTVRPQESIVFGEQPGSALRGALYGVLSDNFCSEPGTPITPDHSARCPVCWLLAREDDQRERGENIPRPLTVQPPRETLYHRGQSLSFGFSLIGQARDLLPYIARAVQKMGQVGVGKGRGRFTLTQVDEVNPILDVERRLLDGNQVKAPTLPITPGLIAERAATLPTTHLTLDFLTPMRLIRQKQLVKYPDPATLIQRLMERCQELATYYSETETRPDRDAWRVAAEALTQHAHTIRLAYDDTHWQEAHSGSQRKAYLTPISGFVGRARWEGDLAPLLPWLLWGQSLHVGKNTVKGDGWFYILHKD